MFNTVVTKKISRWRLRELRMSKRELNNEVTVFLDGLMHPRREEIEYLRKIILDTESGLDEGIKWNGPNYSKNGEDRITMRINRPETLQIILHRGAKVKEQPEERLLSGKYDILVWKENDRAVATLKNLEEILKNSTLLKEIVTKWIEAAK